MTDTQWREELAADVDGTDWVIDGAGVMERYPDCFADAHHRVTNERRHVYLSRFRFPTAATRKVEICRQLSNSPTPFSPRH